MSDKDPINVVFIPGVGGMDAYAKEAIRALSDSGFEVDPIDWTKYSTALMALNFFDRESQTDAVERAKDLLISYKNSGRKVVLVSHSRGASIHAKALIKSGIQIDLSIQMAAGYSSEKLLAKSTEFSENNLFLTSREDSVLLAGVFIHGRPLLGRNGPSKSIPRLDILTYDSGWNSNAHQGGHGDFLKGDFITGFVSPLIRTSVKI
jgi:hypothetical protein